MVADPNPVCFTGTVNLSVTNNKGATYEWTTADANAGLIASSTNTTSMTALQPGTYVINVTQTLNGCTSPAATVTVVVNPLPTTPDFGDVTSTDPTACGVNDAALHCEDNGSVSFTGLTGMLLSCCRRCLGSLQTAKLLPTN